MRDLIFIKLGGSVITDKSQESTPDLQAIERFSKEIYEAQKVANAQFVIGHGAGSFGHPQAKQYRTAEGDIDKTSAFGMAKVRQAVTELNSVMIAALIKQNLPAVTLSPHAFLLSDHKKVKEVFARPMLVLLQHNVIPVIHGDVVTDASDGWTIFSGESILNVLALKSKDGGFKPRLIIEIGKTAGVLDEGGQPIPEITEANYKDIEKLLTHSEHPDVTGGMLHKVQEALAIAKQGIPTLITGATPGNLRSALQGATVVGTTIR